MTIVYTHKQITGLLFEQYMALLVFTQSIIAIAILSVSLDHSLLFLEAEKKHYS